MIVMHLLQKSCLLARPAYQRALATGGPYERLSWAARVLPMVRNPDHITIVVQDVAAATAFFALLGFAPDKSALISGARMERYMGVAGIEAEHETLVLAGATPRFEIQLVHYRHPAPRPNPDAADLGRLGFNHLCFAVDDLDAEVRRLTAHGVRLRNEVMQFHDRKLVFLAGPEGLTIELAEWTNSPL